MKPGGFVAANVGDILRFADPGMPRIRADSRGRKMASATRAGAPAAKKANPGASRHGLAAIPGCGGQAVQRRLEHNNVRGSKPAPGTGAMPTSAMVSGRAEAGTCLYDRRVRHEDPARAGSGWHSSSCGAVDEHEHALVFWNPGITDYDRGRPADPEWGEWGPRGAWRIPPVRRNSRHEAEFPEELAHRVIRPPPPGGIVPDPFAGAGTAACVAEGEGRGWIGMDSDEGCARMSGGRLAAG